MRPSTDPTRRRSVRATRAAGRVRTGAAAVLVAGLLVGGVSGVPAWAEDLEERRDRLTEQLEQGTRRLADSEEQLTAATRRAEQSAAELARGRAELAATRADLEAARDEDTRLQQKLDDAVAELRRARTELARGRQRVAVQERRIAVVALETQQAGDPALLAVASMLTTGDAVELGDRLGAVRSVMDKEAVQLQRLEAARVLQEVRRERLDRARQEVAKRRAAAARNLQSQQELAVAAQAAADRLEVLADADAVAQRQAAQVRARDARTLHDLEQERSRVEQVLRERAAAARAAAREAARQAARKAARQAARESARAAARDEQQRAAAQNRASRSAPARTVSPALATPVDGYVTSSYGMRLHPVYQRWALHDGTDFGAPCGTPVRASESGTVVEAYSHSAYGLRVILDHGLRRGVGLATSYNHLSRYAVSPGQHVQRGQVVGYVGDTGYSTGCHLHFMVFEDGATVNPMTWL